MYTSLPINWINAKLEDIIETLESGSRPKGGVKNIKEGIPSIGGEHLTSNGKTKVMSPLYIFSDSWQ